MNMKSIIFLIFLFGSSLALDNLKNLALKSQDEKQVENHSPDYVAHSDCSKDPEHPHYLTLTELDKLSAADFKARIGEFLHYFYEVACEGYRNDYRRKRIAELRASKAIRDSISVKLAAAGFKGMDHVIWAGVKDLFQK